MKTQQQRESTVTVIVLVLLVYVFSLFVSGFLGHQGFGKVEASIAFQSVILAAGLLMYLTRHGRHSLRVKPPSPRDMILASSFVIALATSDVLTMAGRALAEPGLSLSQIPPFAQLAAEQVLAAIGEELLFTGFLFSTLRLRRSFLISVAIVATIFVMLHWPSSLSGVVARAAYVIAACAIFERTRSILLTISMHFVVNGLTFSAVLLIGDEVPPWLALGGMAAESGFAIGLAVLLLALFSGLPRPASAGLRAASEVSSRSETTLPT